MLFAIRDDDVNFFTQPNELEAAYKNYWEVAPPTFSLISHVKGNWKHWTQEFYRLRGDVDLAALRLDEKIYPLADNGSLVKFLNEQLRGKKLGVSFHAIHHRNEDAQLPPYRENNYVQGAEFFTSRNLSEPLKNAVGYLHKYLDTKINVFTPPQNLLSLKGYHAVIHQRLSVIGAGIPFWKKELSPNGLANMAKVASFKLSNPNKDFPFALHFKNHSEVIHHYPLHPTTTVESLIDKFNHVNKFNGDFILSTHYHEFNEPLVYDSTRTMKDVFKNFMDFVLRKPNVNFCTLNEMCTESKQNR